MLSDLCIFSSELLSSSNAAVRKSNVDCVCPKDDLRRGWGKAAEDAAEAGRSFFAEDEVDLMYDGTLSSGDVDCTSRFCWALYRCGLFPVLCFLPETENIWFFKVFVLFGMGVFFAVGGTLGILGAYFMYLELI